MPNGAVVDLFPFGKRSILSAAQVDCDRLFTRNSLGRAFQIVSGLLQVFAERLKVPESVRPACARTDGLRISRAQARKPSVGPFQEPLETVATVSGMKI